MELGVAGTIGIKEFVTTFVENSYQGKRVHEYSVVRVNRWLENNPDLEIIDIKYTNQKILVIYRKNS